MKRNSHTGIWRYWLLACVLAGAGCAYDVPLRADVEPVPGAEKLPITVGVYYSPEFRGYTFFADFCGDLPTYRLGEASVHVFDEVFPAVFEKVVPLTGIPPSAHERAKLDVIIAPELQDASVMNAGCKWKDASIGALIEYSFVFYDKDANRIVAWTVRGVGDTGGYNPHDIRSVGTIPGINFIAAAAVMADTFAKGDLMPQMAVFRAPVDEAILSAADSFMTELQDVPELQPWLEARNLTTRN